MKRPSIADAKYVSGSLNAKGLIILAFDAEDGGRVAGVSYGVTSASCKRFGKILDRIVDRLMSGEISDFDGFNGRIEQ